MLLKFQKYVDRILASLILSFPVTLALVHGRILSSISMYATRPDTLMIFHIFGVLIIIVIGYRFILLSAGVNEVNIIILGQLVLFFLMQVFNYRYKLVHNMLDLGLFTLVAYELYANNYFKLIKFVLKIWLIIELVRTSDCNIFGKGLFMHDVTLFFFEVTFIIVYMLNLIQVNPLINSPQVIKSYSNKS